MPARRARFIDVALVAGLAGLAYVSMTGPVPSGARAPDTLAVVLVFVQLAGVLVWRRNPAVALAVVVAGWGTEVARGYPEAVPVVPALLVFLSASDLPVRRATTAVGAATAAVAGVLAAGWMAGRTPGGEALAGIAIVSMAGLIGIWWNPHRTHVRFPVPAPSWLRFRPWMVDAAWVIGVATLAFIGLNAQAGSDPGQFRRPDGILVLLQTVQVCTLIARRRLPAGSLWLATLVWFIERLLVYAPTGASLAVIPLHLYWIGRSLPRSQAERMAWSAIAVVVGLTGLGWAVDPTVDGTSLLSQIALTVVPYLLGRRGNERDNRLELAELRARRAEQDRELRTARAVAGERARIARELHDVVAHQMTVMTVQAEGARRLASDADPRVVEALDTIGRAGHQGLTEMRRMVGLLRTDANEELAPQPGLRQLEELMDGMREAGLDVELGVEGSTEAVPDGIALNAYRIVQESLTNALKHGGPGVGARVTLCIDGRMLRLEVVDDGRGAATRREGGHGLIGMRERTALVGGRLEAGPRPGGGFRVLAELPLEAS